MPSAGRKFLLAGKGGLNLTHSEAFDAFASRYGAAPPADRALLKDFDAQALRAWAQGLGIATFVGTSGRVFPDRHEGRALVARLAATVANRGRAISHAPPLSRLDRGRRAALANRRKASERCAPMPSCWPWAARAGRAWAPTARGYRCWSSAASTWRRWRLPIAASTCAAAGASISRRVSPASHSSRSRSASSSFARQGEFVATATGVEGSLIYAASALLRDEIRAQRQRHVRA